MNGNNQEFEAQTESEGPLASMRKYLCEFDPDTGPTSTGPTQNLHGSWTTYVQAFEDLCQVQNIPESNRKPLFLLLGGMKLRVRLNQLTAGSNPNINEVYEVSCHFVFLTNLINFFVYKDVQKFCHSLENEEKFCKQRLKLFS